MATRECDLAMALVIQWERCGAPTAAATDLLGQTGRTTAADPATNRDG